MDKAKVKSLKSLPLRDIGERYGFRFERVGDKLRSLCHFHNDAGTPNLFVYPDDSFFCFACRRGGTKSAFVAYAERVDRKVIEQLWNEDTPPDQLIFSNLKVREADYKPQLQLYLSKCFYDAQAKGLSITLEDMRDLDMRVSSRKFITLEEYSDVVEKLMKKLGGQHG